MFGRKQQQHQFQRQNQQRQSWHKNQHKHQPYQARSIFDDDVSHNNAGSNRLGNNYDNLYLFLPVAFVFGAVLFFHINLQIWDILLIGIAGISFVILKKRAYYLMSVFLLAGIFNAYIHTNARDNPIYQGGGKPVWVRGVIEEIERQEYGNRIILKELDILKYRKAVPHKIRVNIRTSLGDAKIGDYVSVKLSLYPPPRLPVYMGEYNFAKYAFFQGIGAVGYSVTDVYVKKKFAEDSRYKQNNISSKQSSHRLNSQLSNQLSNQANTKLDNPINNLLVYVVSTSERLRETIARRIFAHNSDGNNNSDKSDKSNNKDGNSQSGDKNNHQHALQKTPYQNAIAVALITGKRASIEEETIEDIRKSGIAHLLAISGLHMAMIMFAIFAISRFIMALFMNFALKYNIKKIAAYFAIAFGFFYLVISGMPVSAIRAYIMVSLFFIAIILEKRIFYMRSVAFAALVITLFNPYVVNTAGFHMSFMAVIGLIAVFRFIEGKFIKNNPEKPFHRRLGYYITTIMISSFTAGLATMPYAFFHFGKIAIYGIFANMFAIPIATFMVMPAGMFAVVMMPFGLEPIFLHVMFIGIEAIVEIASLFADIPNSTLRIKKFPSSILLFCSLGVVITCFMKDRARLCGLGMVGLSVIFVCFFTRTPDVLISEDGLIAVKNESGYYEFTGKNHKYAKNIFLKVNAQEEHRQNLVTTNLPVTNLAVTKNNWSAESPSGIYQATECIYVMLGDYAKNTPRKNFATKNFSKHNSAQQNLAGKNLPGNLLNNSPNCKQDAKGKDKKLCNHAGKDIILITEEDLAKNGTYAIFYDSNRTKYNKQNKPNKPNNSCHNIKITTMQEAHGGRKWNQY